MVMITAITAAKIGRSMKKREKRIGVILESENGVAGGVRGGGAPRRPRAVPRAGQGAPAPQGTL
jgi:hypothetical protein